MKKTLLGWFLVLLISRTAFAASVALVYEGEKNVTDGKSVLGTVVEGGVVIPADSISSPKSPFFAAGAGETLRSASLLRMDIQLNTALLKLGDPVANLALQAAHAKRSAAMSSFLPTAVMETTSAAPASTLMPVPSVLDGPFQLKIDGQTVGTDPITLKKSLKKSKFKLEVVMLSSASAWTVEVDLESDPQLAFWKQGRRMGGADIPQKKFHYSEQIFFKPLTAGKSITIPIEVFFIEGEDYLFTFHVTAKGLKMEQKVAIKFIKPK